MNWHNDFNEVIEAIETVGKLYAIAKAESYRMQEMKGYKIGVLIMHSPEKSTVKAEHLAKGTDNYKKYIEETAKAIEKEYDLKAQLDRLKCQFEGMRSLVSLEKKSIEKFE